VLQLLSSLGQPSGCYPDSTHIPKNLFFLFVFHFFALLPNGLEQQYSSCCSEQLLPLFFRDSQQAELLGNQAALLLFPF